MNAYERAFLDGVLAVQGYRVAILPDGIELRATREAFRA